MNIDKLKLGHAIKEIRTGLKITQKHLSKKSGLTINYLSLLENGKRGIGMDHLNKLADIFGIPTLLIIALASDYPDKKNKDANRLLNQIQIITQQAIALYLSC